MFHQLNGYSPGVRLLQGQVWKHGKEYIRLVRVQRLEVEYKILPSLSSKAGVRRTTSKKDFCRLLKQARLLTPSENPIET